MEADNFNNETPKLSELVLKIKGDRSYRRFAEDAGISLAAVGRMTTEDYKPSMKMIDKLMSDAANPNKVVTKFQLMEAAGYKCDLTDEDMKQVVSDFNKSGNSEYQLTRPGSGARVKNKPLERTIWGIISSVLISGRFGGAYQGFMLSDLLREGLDSESAKAILKEKGFEYIPDNVNHIYNYQLRLENQAIDTWNIYCPDVFIPNHMLNGQGRRKLIFIQASNLAKICLAEEMFSLRPDDRRKTSFIFSLEEQYETFKDICSDILYKGELSVILVDATEGIILKEEYLSHYYDQLDKNNIITFIDN